MVLLVAFCEDRLLIDIFNEEPKVQNSLLLRLMLKHLLTSHGGSMDCQGCASQSCPGDKRKRTDQEQRCGGLAV